VLPLVREAGRCASGTGRTWVSQRHMEYMSAPAVVCRPAAAPEWSEPSDGLLVPRGSSRLGEPGLSSITRNRRPLGEPGDGGSGGLQCPRWWAASSGHWGRSVKICLVNYRYFVQRARRYMFAVKTLLEAGQRSTVFRAYRQNIRHWERYFAPPIAATTNHVPPAFVSVRRSAAPWSVRSAARVTTLSRESCATRGPTWRTS